ncbi:hypothetical protein AB0G15_05735 [Streptosporangium sp. NPDC023825]|uniref:hypothetical protein n=1 Tax=Streptosporangium sp. NPDC023825 TaxID=3154909 RepID=UPI003422DBE7
MPLSYEVDKELEVPDGAFDKNDIATILVTGGRYGGHWQLTAIPLVNGVPTDEAIGQIMTAQDNRPDMAIDTAVVWINDACQKADFKLAHFENKNNLHSPDEAPYFASGLFFVDRRK